MHHDTSSKALKSGLWYIISNFTSRAIGFFSTPIFTHLLTKEELGDFSSISSWLNMLCIICTFNMSSSVFNARFDFKNTLNDYITSNLLFGSIITGLFYLITNIDHEFWLNFFSMAENEYRLIFLYLLVCQALEMLQAESRIFYKYKLSVLLSFLSTFGVTLISIICVLKFDDKYQGRLYGYIIPLIVLNAIIYVAYLVKNRSINLLYCKYALLISFPVIWHSLANSILNSSDRIMIKSLCSSSDVALYSIACTCAVVVQVLWSSLQTAWVPWAYEKMNENDSEALIRATKPYCLLFAIIVFLFLLFAPELLLVLGGADYYDALAVIPAVMVAYVFQFAYSLYVNIELYHRKQKWMALGTILAASINVGLNCFYIPVFGYIAAAYTTLIGYLVLVVFHFLITRNFGLIRFCPNQFVFKFVIIFILFIPLMLFIYKYSILRFFVITFLAMIVMFIGFRNRELILQLIHTRDFTVLFSLNLKVVK